MRARVWALSVGLVLAILCESAEAQVCNGLDPYAAKVCFHGCVKRSCGNSSAPPCDSIRRRWTRETGGAVLPCDTPASTTTTTVVATTTTTACSGSGMALLVVCGTGAPIDPLVTLSPGDTIRCETTVNNTGCSSLSLESIGSRIHHVAGTVTSDAGPQVIAPGGSLVHIQESVVAAEDATRRCTSTDAVCTTGADCAGGNLCIGFCDSKQQACQDDTPCGGVPCLGLLPAEGFTQVSGAGESFFGAGVAVTLGE